VIKNEKDLQKLEELLLFNCLILQYLFW